jgi:hypothetical protein
VSVRFLGDWNPWLGAGVAALLAGLAWYLYRRETRHQASRLSWILPLSRTLVVFLAILMLTGPVVHHRKVVGERGRVLVFVDTSLSMKLTDDSMETSRKLLAAQRLGWLSPEALDAKLAASADALSQARRAAGGDSVDATSWKDSSQRFARGVESAFELLGQVKSDTGGVALERKGVILREYWTGLPGGSIDDLRRHPGFPNKPDGYTTPEIFAAPVDWGDNYGTRMRGFVEAPDTGAYVFWIAADDQGELWLSTDADPAHKVLIARAPSWTPPNGWDTIPEQKSGPIRLNKGQKYYIEALHKESTGGDHVSVGWQLPKGTMERPIPGTRLSAPTTTGETPARALDAMKARFREELLGPVQALAAQRRDGNQAKAISSLNALLAVSARWERELREAFANYANRVAASPDSAVLGALQKFDAMPRSKRVEAMLTGGPKSLLEQLSEKHAVEVLSIGSGEAATLWSTARAEGDLPERAPRSLALDPQARTTNLSDGLRARIGESREERVAAVLISDGQHNDGSSPLGTAKMFGNRQVPIYTVSVGSTALPEDLAILKIKAPNSAFFKDRVRGEIVLKDDMPPGRPFTARIEAKGQVLWEKKLSTEQSHLRTVPFDFPIRELVDKVLSQKESGLEMFNVPLALHASVSAVDGEKEKSNNEADFDLHAIMHRRKVLLLDGRPRWEIRYLRNLFDRDEQWEVNALLADRGQDQNAWPRGQGPGKFPADRESLFAYDMIVFGEVPRQFLKMEELEWIRDFVGKRGGGILVIDGRRGHVSNFADTPLGPLFPVDWKADSGRPARLQLSERGARLAMLSLAPDPEKNAETWSSLPAPHWIAPARALPGSEVLLEAAVGERKIPALVYRRFGAGKVLYAGFDESWRWRYEVADLHHQRYWNQVVREVMEQPFAVKSPRVSLDAGQAVYGNGESATVRARLSDAAGKPVERSDAEAWLYRDGRKVAALKLVPDENGGGVFRGATAPLSPGQYEVRIHGEGLPELDQKVKTEFVVRPPEAGELAVLNANEDLLRQIADQSGGEFFREEEASELPSRLEPLSREKVFESDTALWQSWWWFAPLVSLLTLEWILRKWAGML